MISPFNTPLETGTRALAILDALFPNNADLQTLVTLDYLVVHSGDAGGPRSLHAPLPLRSGELLVRRGLIERGLSLMESRGLIAREASNAGFYYRATESSTPFLGALQSAYSNGLKARAEWAAEAFGAFSEAELLSLVRKIFNEWTTEFQQVELPLGTE